MAATAISHREEQRIARPLKVLVPLIQEQLDQAQKASLQNYRAAGELLLEAKDQVQHGDWGPWLDRHFHMSRRTASDYMRLAQATQGYSKRQALPFSTLSDVVSPNRPARVNEPEWHQPVQRIVSSLDTETLNLKREELKRADEREAQRQLALQLIDIGYKVLARTLHPDKGGSREAMARLNAVRDRLKASA